MRAEFSIVTSTRDGVMTVPRESVQGDASGRFVYIADYELKNAFVKTPVQLGAQNDRFVEITNGLLPGDQVVTRGAYALGFAGKGSVSLKEALDAAHGHPHNEDGTEMTKEQRAAAAVVRSPRLRRRTLHAADGFFRRNQRTSSRPARAQPETEALRKPLRKPMLNALIRFSLRHRPLILAAALLLARARRANRAATCRWKCCRT